MNDDLPEPIDIIPSGLPGFRPGMFEGITEDQVKAQIGKNARDSGAVLDAIAQRMPVEHDRPKAEIKSSPWAQRNGRLGGIAK